MRWASVFCAFTLVQLSVFGAVVEGNTISDWSVHKGFRILSFNPFSTEDSVLITVKLWFRNHQAGVVFCTSVFYAYKLQTKQKQQQEASSLETSHFWQLLIILYSAAIGKNNWKHSLKLSIKACITSTTHIKNWSGRYQIWSGGYSFDLTAASMVYDWLSDLST